MLRKIFSQKKLMALFLILSLCLILVIGCSNNNQTAENEEVAQTETIEKKETEASDLNISGAKDITEGKIYEAVAEVANINYIKEMEVEGELVLYINIKEDSSETFIEAAEKIAALGEIRMYPSINLSTNNLDKETAMLTISWNDEQARYESVCWDLTTDKRVEEVYKQNEFFSNIDMMNIFYEDLDDIKDEYLN